jgi:hypothetical protein
MVFTEQDVLVVLIPLDPCKPSWITTIRLWSEILVGSEDFDPNCEKKTI